MSTLQSAYSCNMPDHLYRYVNQNMKYLIKVLPTNMFSKNLRSLRFLLSNMNCYGIQLTQQQGFWFIVQS